MTSANDSRAIRFLAALLAAVLAGGGAAAGEAPLTVVLTADLEGRLAGDDAFARDPGRGALARKAAAIADLCRKDKALLLLDAGNAFFGPESLPSGGKAVAAAYGAMGYDAVNLSWRDFRLGKERTLALEGECPFPVITTNIADEAGGKLLGRPYAVLRAGDRKIAVLGATEPPPAKDDLPHLTGQLAGIRFLPPGDAVAEWLPKARAESDAAVLLFYGSAGVARELSKRFGANLAVVLVGGAPPEHLPRDAAIAAAFGSALARVRLERLGAAPVVERVEVPGSLEPDPEVAKLVAPSPAPGPGGPPPAVAPQPPASLPPALEPGRVVRLGRTVSNRAATLILHSEVLDGSYGRIAAPEGRRFLILDAEWENIMPAAFVEERQVPVQYQIPNVSDHLYILVDGRRLARLRPDAGNIPGHLPPALTLVYRGDRLRRNILFEVPAEGARSLELRFYDYANGHIATPLLATAGAPAAEKPVFPLRRNEILELGVFGIRKADEMGGRRAPEGMKILAVEFRGRSLIELNADASAFDPLAKNDRKIKVGTVADWKESQQYLQLVADGEYARGPEKESSLDPEPRFLPDVLTGGEVVFLAPTDAASLELRCDFPNTTGADEEEASRPTALVFPLEGKRPAPPERTAIASAVDEMFKVDVWGQAVSDEFAGEKAAGRKKFLLLDVTVSNTGETGEWFQVTKQLEYVTAQGEPVPVDPIRATKGPHPAGSIVWVPGEERRTFQIAYQIDRTEVRPRLLFTSATAAQTLELKKIPEEAGGPASSEPKAPPVAGKAAPAPPAPAAPAGRRPGLVKTEEDDAGEEKDTEEEVSGAEKEAGEMAEEKSEDPEEESPEETPDETPDETAEEIAEETAGKKAAAKAPAKKAASEDRRGPAKGAKRTPGEPPSREPAAAQGDLAAGLPIRVPARQDRTPLGLAGVGLTAEDVNRTIDRAARFLWDLVKKERKGRPTAEGREIAEAEVLILLALVHADGAKKFPDFDKGLRSFIEAENLARLQEPHMSVYQGGLFCMLLDSYGNKDYYPKLRQMARVLVESQGPGGSWSYGLQPLDEEVLLEAAEEPKGPWKRVTPRENSDDGDNSNTQYALLGLHSAARKGVPIPEEVWRRNLDNQRKRQDRTGGWAYNDPEGPYGSMSCAGICAIAIDRFHLGAKDPADDEGIEKGLGWLDRYFRVDENPNATGWTYYYVYSVERVGRILDVDFIGEHEWYPLGARHLVDAQEKDGSWLEDDDSMEGKAVGTSFGLLFLTRATEPLSYEKPKPPPPMLGGSGILRTTVPAVEGRSLYLILDASGSMMEEMTGRRKFDIARDAVAEVVTGLPPSARIGLRVFGHTKAAIEEGADEDTAFEVPLGPLDREAFLAKLRSLRPRGKTPLALSMEKAAEDISSSGEHGKVTVILLTDGKEDSLPRRDPLKAAEALGTLENVRLEVVGFDIGRDDWAKELAGIARQAQGRYWPAGRAADLRREMRSLVLAIPAEFVVLDRERRAIASGSFGESRTLPPGEYILQAPVAARLFEQPFSIRPDATTVVAYDPSKLTEGKETPEGPAVKIEAAAGKSQTTPPKADAPPEKEVPTRKFCTDCGAVIKPGVKFCTGCGQKLN